MSIWAKIKNFLKSILPTPTKAFVREMELMQERLGRQDDIIEAMNRENLRIYQEAREERRNMEESLRSLTEEVASLRREIKDSRDDA